MGKIKNVDVHINIGDYEKILGWYEYNFENLSKKEMFLQTLKKAYRWIDEGIPPCNQSEPKSK